MWIYVINIVLIIYWWLMYSFANSMRIKTPLYQGSLTINNEPMIKESLVKKVILLLPFLQVYLLLSLKNDSIGSDTISYKYVFNLMMTTSWQSIFSSENIGTRFELGFVMLTKFITMFTETYAVYSAILFVILILPLYKIIKKYSTMPYLSLILFIALGFLNFYSSGLRQAMAMSIILLSYNYIIKRKLWKFVILVAIATQCHQSAIFFFPAYFLMNLTITRKVGLFYFTTLAIAFVFRFQIVGYITQFMFSDVQIQSTGAYTLLLIVLLTFIIGLFSYKKVIAMNHNNKLLYNLIAVAVGLMIVTTVTYWGLRVAYYYYIFMILFIPNLLAAYKEKLIMQVAVTVVIVFTLIYYFQIGVYALNGTPYKFFWQ